MKSALPSDFLEDLVWLQRHRPQLIALLAFQVRSVLVMERSQVKPGRRVTPRSEAQAGAR